MCTRSVLIFAFAATTALAAPEMRSVCNSAPLPGGGITVNADLYDTIAPRPTTARVFYSTDNQTSWNEAPMPRIGTPGYDSTFSGWFPIPGSGTVHYYLRGDDNKSYATQTPDNSGNAWPPGDNLMAELAAESTGDATDPEGPWMDIAGARIGYSSDHFYAMITNNYSSWPLYRFPTPWYIYSVGLINREMPNDTWFFTMDYANIPGLFSPGIYVLNRYNRDYARLGDIDYYTNGNRLYMRCLISTITSDPRFGPWPNSYGYLMSAAGTMSFYGLSDRRVRDATDTSSVYFKTPSFTVGQNQPPTVSNARVAPGSGPPETSFWFSARYTDENNHLPPVRMVKVDSDSFALIPNHHRYNNGVNFEHRRSGFAPGWHQFQFAFDDGMSRVTTALDSFLVTGTGIADWEGANSAQLGATPNPFRGQVRFSGIRNRWLEIRNGNGRLVRRLRALAASGSATWDGLDEQGREQPAGVYFLCTTGFGLGSRLRIVRLRP